MAATSAESAEPAESDKPGLADRLKARLASARERWPLLDQGVRTGEHMGAVQGTMLAGALTYFGFLSFFPLLVIAFVVAGYVAAFVPEARDQTIEAIRSFFPGLIGGEKAAISIETFRRTAGAVGVVALAGLLYSGLGWISALRNGLQGVFRVPKSDRFNPVVGKVVDLGLLMVIGVVLVVSVALSSAVVNLTELLLELLMLDDVLGVGVLLQVVGVLLAMVASTVLFFTIFSLLPTSQLPRRALVKGAVAAALGFEVLKLLAATLIGLAADNPATAVLGISLVLLVWINYFSQVIMAGAAWAYTSPEARRIRDREAERQRTRAELAERRRLRRERYGRRRRMGVAPGPLDPVQQRRVDRLSVAAGATVGMTASAVVNAVRRRR
jgi:membrane protein